MPIHAKLDRINSYLKEDRILCTEKDSFIIHNVLYVLTVLDSCNISRYGMFAGFYTLCQSLRDP